ncbi:MAG: hypothetical protein ACRER8_09300 [Pseudomonas sp.]
MPWSGVSAKRGFAAASRQIVGKLHSYGIRPESKASMVVRFRYV